MFRTFISVGVLFIMLSSSLDASIRLNEIYPAPDSEGYEWVEIHNDASEAADVSEMAIVDAKNNQMVLKGNSIEAFGFLLATATGVLNNANGDTISIVDQNGETLDSISYTSNFSSGESYSYCANDDSYWIKTTITTQNSVNSPACIQPSPSPTTTNVPTPTPTLTEITETPQPTPTATKTSTPPPSPTMNYKNIFISEVMTYPQPSNREWVELFNNNDFDVSLDDWQIDDIEGGGSSPKLFSLMIGKKSYATVEMSTSLFNNSGDTVRLIDLDRQTVDEITYANSTKGVSWGKIAPNDSEICIQNPSRNLPNNACIQKKTIQAPSPTVPPSIATTVPTAIYTPREEHFVETDTNLPKQEDVSTKSASITVPKWLLHSDNASPIDTTPASTAGDILGDNITLSNTTSNEDNLHIVVPITGIVSSILTISSILYRMKI